MFSQTCVIPSIHGGGGRGLYPKGSASGGSAQSPLDAEPPLPVHSGFPLGLENLENLEKWEGIFQSGKSQGILNRLEKSGKTTQNTGKLR